MLQLSDEQYNLLFSELSLDEGIKLKVYNDTKGIKTVGIGCNLQAHDVKPIIGRKLTKIGESITKHECFTRRQSAFATHNLIKSPTACHVGKRSDKPAA